MKKIFKKKDEVIILMVFQFVVNDNPKKQKSVGIVITEVNGQTSLH